MFFLADRKGWVLAADHHTPADVDALRAAGARFLVVGDPQLVPPGAPLAAWLADNARQLRAGERDGCAVRDLAASASSGEPTDEQGTGGP